ncbi:MAG: hypothetical protein V4722_24015 [Bacteroidota bacterium]
MKQLFILSAILLTLSVSAKAQQPIKLDYLVKVPTAYKDCGSLYTFDTTALAKKKYVLVVDLQNTGMIMVDGKAVKLLMGESKTVGKTNIVNYTGGGYTVVLSYATTNTKGKLDMESGTIEVTKGSSKLKIKMHGQTSCDESKQEGNS